MYEPSSYYDLPDFKPFDCQEKVKEFIALLKYPEVQAVLKLFIDNSIAISDLQILKRLAAVETALGLNDFSEEDSQPTIPAQLIALTERVDSLAVDSKPNHGPVEAPVTKTESRACLLVQRLKSLKSKKFLSSQEIVQFLKYGIEERYRVGEKQNVRQVKKEVLEKSLELFPNMQLDKKKYGRREVRLVLGT
jgi:hypothetical protein